MRVPSTAAAVSPDGRTLAFADRRLGIRLVNADTYVDIRRWDAHTDGIWSLSFSPDGRWLLSASEDQTVGVWNVAHGGGGSLVTRLTGHGAQVLCAAMSPDGKRIASGGRDGIVRFWDTTHFENVAQLAGHGDYVYSLTWSPDGHQLISTSGDSTVRIWDTRTFAEQMAAARDRTDSLPNLEARMAKARHDAALAGSDVSSAVDQAVAAADLTPRQREIARQVATRFAFQGIPAYYRAPKASSSIVIDGKVDEAEWNAAPWSGGKPKPRFETRVRMLWDDEYLYVAARMEEPHVSATLTQRDEIVFNDNDFEVFIDPEGDSRYYGEVEVNALSTIFDLRMDKPYIEGGPAHHDWSPTGIRAVASVQGTLNDPSDTDSGWTVEIAIPHAALMDHAAIPTPAPAPGPTTHVPPKPGPHPGGEVWRINFSRVQWQYDVIEGRYVKRPGLKEDNWVWSPQHVIDMHRPREWGFVEFADHTK
jgi:hypothetical protein